MTKMASVTHKPSHRRRVGEGISRKRSCAASGGRGSWPAFPVPEAFADSLVGQGDDRQLAMQPSRLTEFIALIRERFEEAARQGEAPVLVTSASIRPFVRSIVERFRSQTTVLSQSEIHPRARLKTVGSI